MFIARRDSVGVVLVDSDGDLAESAAADISEAAPLLGFEPDLVGGTDPALTAGSEVVVIAAGVRPGDARSRKDLLRKNSEIVTGICHGVMERSPNACVVVVTEPLEQTCELVARTTQFPRARLIGVSGVLDTARWTSLVARELGVSGWRHRRAGGRRPGRGHRAAREPADHRGRRRHGADPARCA